MKKIFLFILSLIIFNFNFAQTQFYNSQFLSLTPSGAMKHGLFGYDNPAVLSTINDFEFYFFQTDDGIHLNKIQDWGIITAVQNFGFSYINFQTPLGKINDYRFSSAFGSKQFSFGLAYGWLTSASPKPYSNVYVLGALYRPSKYLSTSIVEYFPNEGESESIFEFAVRPFGNELLSVFGDYLYKKTVLTNESKWSAGLALEAIDGLRLTGRYYENKTINLGLQLGLGNVTLSTANYTDKNNNTLKNIFGIRIGSYDRNLIRSISKSNNYFSLDLSRPVKYQKYKLFDRGVTLLEILNNIESAKFDQSIKGIVINAANISADFEKLWEIRTKLKDFKSAGKKIIIFIERPNIRDYYFASVADYIVLDPIGMIELEGFILGRYFVKGTLEKLGIGYDEWRFFKYKSAVETFSRDKMSDADREQRKEIIDDWYQLVKDEICESRNISTTMLDSIINNKVMMLSDEALSLKLIDRVGRWEEVDSILIKIEDKKPNLISGNQIEKNLLPDDNYWGKKPQIAVIYGIGGTSLEGGINARSLSKQIEAVAGNKDIKAVVFRADSPGGDALAADLIADALLKCKKNKPVIVSQGAVAGSGGYWISMYGDTIIAAPNTITGSIGVIGGWFYNKSLKEYLGVSTDYVKKGEHADLGFGFSFPLINFPLPDRNLTDEEKIKMEEIIKRMYTEFVKKVANGRNKKFEEIEKIAQGRIFSGVDGKSIGLVDLLGGLNTAIDVAKMKAGIKDDNYEIVEIPESPLIDFNQFMPKLISTQLEESEIVKNLKMRMELNGKPLLMMPLEMEILLK